MSMNSESPRKAIFASPLTSSDVGGDRELGRLVAASAMDGSTPEKFAEKALIHAMRAEFGVSETEAVRLLRGLESGHNRGNP